VVNITSGFGIWRLGTEGSIRFVENARLKGSPVIVQGALEAVDGSSHVDVNATLTGTSLVTVHNGAQLSFHDHVAYGGGSITTVSGNLDNSLLHQFSTGNVLEHHTVTVGFFDWDADNNTDSHTTIQPDGFFDIKAKQIGNGITDPLLFFLARSGFGDTIDINGGKLGVEVGFDSRVEESFPHSWTLNATGVMNLNREGHSLPAVQGSKLINYGLISGTGTFFNELQNKAAIRVGHAGEIGLIQMMNGFQQTAEGTMAFELAGLAPTTEFDQVYHDAEMSLAGTLEVDLIGGFQPSPGDIFRIIVGNEMAPISGSFSTTQLPPGEWDVIYGSTYVDLRFNAVPEPATVSMAAFAAACGASWNLRRRLMKGQKEANDRGQG
jgi:hypothetical protein